MTQLLMNELDFQKKKITKIDDKEKDHSSITIDKGMHSQNNEKIPNKFNFCKRKGTPNKLRTSKSRSNMTV